MAGWWQTTLPEDLDQGDIYRDVPFILPVSPLQPLGHVNLKGNKAGWEVQAAPRFDNQGHANYIAKGPTQLGMVLNYGCDIIKPTNKRWILVPVSPLSKYPPGTHQTIQLQGQFNLFFLPGVPNVGDCVADFRIVTSLPREVVAPLPRLAGMTAAAREQLGARLVAFFLRLDLKGEQVGGD